MARKRILSEAEKSIGNRLLEVRQALIQSREKVGEIIGQDVSVVKRLELGRTVIKYAEADAFCRELDVNQFWLWRGIGSPHSYNIVADDLAKSIAPEMPFSRAVEQFLWPSLDSARQNLLSAPSSVASRRLLAPIGLPAEQRYAWSMLQEMQAILNGIPRDRLPSFWEFLSGQVDNFCAVNSLKRSYSGLLRPPDWPVALPVPHNYPATPRTNLQSGKINIKSQESLDNSPASEDNQSMQREIRSLPELIQRLRQLTKVHGAKAALAKQLKVSRQSVDQWLSEKSKPSADMTFELLQWVKRSERIT